ncbi:MAG: FAD-dependent oxidoreductase [Candidatus Kapabacteria bacterium]|nr:FAD-dependent oxidoreductase [Candidatus Kapabacteria bacterium]MDW8012416.1 FAD-dependent oxidoreductase [Bacteroidota bacterium]
MERSHYVVVVGGAVAGAEAAYQLAQRGIRVAVLEQYPLPYGKIEYGLPKWHVKLRNKEEAAIDAKLQHQLVRYVPKVRLGRDVRLTELLQWGVSAVILANGAWRDRPFPVPEAEQYIGRGFYYQNPFMAWFNLMHDPDSGVEPYEIADGAVVIGGGLASIDVAKALMMLTVEEALRRRGIETNVIEMEHGIDRILQRHGLTLQDLGIQGCTLYYRRQAQDMPLTPMPTDTPERLARAQAVRLKVLETARRRYLFNFQELRLPVGILSEGGRMVGLVLCHTRKEGDHVVPVEGTEHEVRTPLVISSIGSIPEPLPEIPMRGETYAIADPELCRIEGYDNVFAVGNAVTGRGNIQESLRHSREVMQRIVEDYLGWSAAVYEALTRDQEACVAEATVRIAQQVRERPPLTADQIQAIDERITRLWEQVGYDGDYSTWVRRHLPKRLEELLRLQVADEE